MDDERTTRVSPTAWGGRREGCPHRNVEDAVCEASLLPALPKVVPEDGPCASEDHDSCPLFLGALLRMSSGRR